MTAWRRAPQLLVLGLVLVLTALVVPSADVRSAPASLVKVESASDVDHSPHVLWVLLLGSDARPGEPVLRSRADAVQLVGLNTRTGAGTAIGIPRDSHVNVPGYGPNKINISMTYGGPQLMARSVGDMVGIRPDYVFTTGFAGFVKMVNRIGGITVESKFAFSDPVMPGGYKIGRNEVTGYQALIFSRNRKSLPNGDFDRSANQQRTLLGILTKVRSTADRPGFVERGVLAAVQHLDTDLGPAELFRLAQAASQISPARFRTCVIQGTIGYVGLASVVFPDLRQARNLGNRARDDATITGPC